MLQAGRASVRQASRCRNDARRMPELVSIRSMAQVPTWDAARPPRSDAHRIDGLHRPERCVQPRALRVEAPILPHFGAALPVRGGTVAAPARNLAAGTGSDGEKKRRRCSLQTRARRLQPRPCASGGPRCRRHGMDAPFRGTSMSARPGSPDNNTQVRRRPPQVRFTEPGHAPGIARSDAIGMIGVLVSAHGNGMGVDDMPYLGQRGIPRKIAR